VKMMKLVRPNFNGLTRGRDLAAFPRVKATFPEFIQPMMPSLVEGPFNHRDWICGTSWTVNGQ
jgi:hypothetical protein